MAQKIVTENADPATWLSAAKDIAVKAGLDVTRCLPLGVPLFQVCFAVEQEATKHGQKRLAELAKIIG